MSTVLPFTLPGTFAGSQPLVSHFDAALIAEIRAKELEHQLHQVELPRGLRREASSSGTSYEFVFDGSLEVGDRGEFSAGGMGHKAEVIERKVDGKERPTVVLLLEADIGKVAPRGTFTLAIGLLKVLREHLADVPPEFNLDLAMRTVAGCHTSRLGAPAPNIDWLADRLNEEQLNAVANSFEHPVSITWGPPGTGKTKTLSATAEAHFNAGNSVLIVAPTHDALDRVLEEARPWIETIPGYQEGIVLRLGKIKSPSLAGLMAEQVEHRRVHRRLATECAAELQVLESTLVEGQRPDIRRSIAARMKRLEGFLSSKAGEMARRARIVFATTHRTYLAPLVWRGSATQKSIVLVDEAGMVSLPLLFSSAGLAERSVGLFGDFRQLPPVVKSKSRIATRWLGQTGFDGHRIPEAVATESDPPCLTMLTEQYRMAPSICALVSDASYAGRLQTAPSHWHLRQPVAALPDSALYLLDTTQLNPRAECLPGGSRLNRLHAELICGLVGSVKTSERHGVSTMILSPFRAQVTELNRQLKAARLKVRARTIHRSQGGEADVAIIDLVDADETRLPLFLQARGPDDPGARLLNVAISRAKRCVVLVGAVDRLIASPSTGKHAKMVLSRVREDAIQLDPRAYLSRGTRHAA